MTKSKYKPPPWNLWNLPAHPQLYKDAKLPEAKPRNPIDLKKINNNLNRLLTERKK